MKVFRDFFRDRYGVDTLSIVTIILGLILIKYQYVYILGIALIGISGSRILSRDIEKRFKEKQKFDSIIYKIKTKVINT